MPIICWIVVGVGGAVVISCGPYLFIRWLRTFEKKQIVAGVKRILLCYAIFCFTLAAFSLAWYLLLHDFMDEKDSTYGAKLSWTGVLVGSVSIIVSAVVFGYGRIAARRRHENPHSTP
jgi:hypothetical protein